MEHQQVPEGLLYERSHYWVKVAGKEASIGLTAYGQDTIGDILYLELVPAGTAVRKGEKFGSVESSKWVGTMLTPITGVVLQTNSEVEASPRLINIDPYRLGWMLMIEISDFSELELLMDANAYQQWVKEEMQRDQGEKEVI